MYNLPQVSGVQESRVSPAPVCGWTATHVAGIVGDGGGIFSVGVAATTGPILHHRIGLVSADPLEAEEESVYRPLCCSYV